MVGDDIAEDGIRYLQEINFKDRARRLDRSGVGRPPDHLTA